MVEDAKRQLGSVEFDNILEKTLIELHYEVQ